MICRPGLKDCHYLVGFVRLCYYNFGILVLVFGLVLEKVLMIVAIDLSNKTNYYGYPVLIARSLCFLNQ